LRPRGNGKPRLRRPPRGLNTAGDLPARPRAGDRGADRSRRVGLHGSGAGRPEGAAGSEGGLVAKRRLLILPCHLPTNNLFRPSPALSARHRTVRLQEFNQSTVCARLPCVPWTEALPGKWGHRPLISAAAGGLTPPLAEASPS